MQGCQEYQKLPVSGWVVIVVERELGIFGDEFLTERQSMAKKNRSTNLTKLNERLQQSKEAKHGATLYSDGNGGTFRFKKAKINGVKCYEMVA